jgi:hypothetical protein
VVLFIVAVVGLLISLGWRERWAKLGCGAFFVALIAVLALVGVR